MVTWYGVTSYGVTAKIKKRPKYVWNAVGTTSILRRLINKRYGKPFKRAPSFEMKKTILVNNISNSMAPQSKVIEKKKLFVTVVCFIVGIKYVVF